MGLGGWLACWLAARCLMSGQPPFRRSRPPSQPAHHPCAPPPPPPPATATAQAPIFEARFFQDLVRPTLWDAFTGWGLDFVWPFLLHYPRDKVVSGHGSSRAASRKAAKAAAPLARVLSSQPSGRRRTALHCWHHHPTPQGVVDEVCMLHPHSAQGKQGEGRCAGLAPPCGRRLRRALHRPTRAPP